MRSFEYAPEQLQALLTRKQMTPQQLATRTQIAPVTIRDYLAGRRSSISTRNMLAMAGAFDMSLADFIDYLAKQRPESEP